MICRQVVYLDSTEAERLEQMQAFCTSKLRNKLRKQLDVDVPVVKFLENPIIAELAREINQQWSLDDTTQLVGQLVTVSALLENEAELLANPESLSDAEIEELLAITLINI